MWCIYLWSSILEPDAWMYDAHIYDSGPCSWYMHAFMMRQILSRMDGRTNERTNKTILGDRFLRMFPSHIEVIHCCQSNERLSMSNVVENICIFYEIKFLNFPPSCQHPIFKLPSGDVKFGCMPAIRGNVKHKMTTT